VISFDDSLVARAAVHAALGEPARLAIVEQLVVSDRSPGELGEQLGFPSNLLAHHLDVLVDAGLVVRFASAGDGRRKYVRLIRPALAGIPVAGPPPAGELLFLCSHNSARSQLAAALWSARTGERARSAGTHPASRVHRGAIAAAKRAGLRLDGAVPTAVGAIGKGTQVVTVCDRAHEELEPTADWWHWSIPDPVEVGTAAAFDGVVAELEERIGSLVPSPHTDPEVRR
jgi:ArsR family transcriptional regulator, arsenate/arsenite/antimonite-responsive transcriptional repressor / arsenate reductase (thioredoxin)